METVKIWPYLIIGFLYFTVIVYARSNDLYSDVPSPYLKDCLVEINKYRQQHGSLPLRWAADLQLHAQSWADHLAQANTVENDLDNLNKLRQGQTVSYSSPAKPRCQTYPPAGDCYACRDTVAKWYNESKYYNYKTGFSVDGKKQVLHFTQLVWKDTVKIGIATAISPWYGLITVARYHPRGNIGYVDDYVINVSPYGTKVDDEDDDDDEDDFSNNGDRRGSGPPYCRIRKRRSHGCKNEANDKKCAFYRLYPGYCNYNKHFMKKHCARTCGFCTILESEVERKENLRWDVGEWKKCNGDFVERVVKCFHTHNNLVYELKPHECAKELGKKPAEFKTCA